ncbi:MAG TPA: LysR family transcriptional regulator [Alphaproteobacteria bacterium]|jgi:DNA-binding transcriptional LysR family regulator|nr:LysR family transcriptional regulator [Alphaproteobacteria bacterium]
MLDWNDLKFFIGAVRAGNYTHAAARLKVNRTTIGRRINALETQLGISLFEQTPTGYRPTTAGRAVLECAEGIEREIERLNERLATPHERLSGTVRIAVSGEIGTEFMGELLAFRKSDPDIKLELLTARDALTNVLQRKADLGICLVAYRPENVRGIRIGMLQQAVYAAKTYLDALPPNHGFQDHDWIGWGKEAANSAAARWLKANLPDAANVSAEVNSWDAFKEAVLHGLGIGHMWCFVADRESGLVRIRDIEPELSMELWLLVRDDVPPDSHTRRLMEFLAPAMQRRVGN